MKYQIMDVFLGSKLKEARESLKISQVDAARKVGISRQRLFNYENGSRSMPMNIYVDLCSFYGLDHEKLFKKAQAFMIKNVF